MRPSSVRWAVIYLLVLILFLLAVGAVLERYIAPTSASERKDIAGIVVQVAGGLIVLTGLFFTWRTLELNRHGQITDRFTKAVEQLGASDGKGDRRLEIRLGGIYALERIAGDSPDRDYGPIMELLTAYERVEKGRLARYVAREATLA